MVLRKESIILAYVPSNSLTLKLEDKTVNKFVFTAAGCISSFSRGQEGQSFLSITDNRESVSYHVEPDRGPLLMEMSARTVETIASLILLFLQTPLAGSSSNFSGLEYS